MKNLLFFSMVFMALTIKVAAQCNVPITVPYYENFSSGVGALNLPVCSKNETIPGADGFWKGYPMQTGGILDTDFGNFSSGIRIWWITPKILVEASKSYRITFDYQGNQVPLKNPTLSCEYGICDSSICLINLITGASITDQVKRTLTKVFTPGITDTINIGFYYMADFIDGCSAYISNISLVEEIPTPVTMGALVAQVQGSTTNLYWQTYTEQNNKGFTVEQSINGQPFTSLGFVPTKAANGNSAAPLSYQYTVGGAATAQYRLHQQDFNGAVSYSNIVAVTSGGKPKAFSVKVLPNPVTNNLQASLYSPAAYKGIAQVVNSTGRQVYVQAVNLPAGFSSLSIPASQWPTGSYYLKINGVVIGFVK